MGITVTNVTARGTDYPWPFQSAGANPGTPNTLFQFTAATAAFNDGSNAKNGLTVGNVNNAWAYGQQHGNASETAPTILAVTAGQVIIVLYNSGTVNTQGSGASSCGPAGVSTTGLTPRPGAETDGNGYTASTGLIAGQTSNTGNSYAQNGTGTVNTSGTTVTWVSGSTFNPFMQGRIIWINNVPFTVSKVNSSTTLTLTATAGTQTGVTFFTYGQATNEGGLTGAFMDASYNIISVWDWAGWGGSNTTGTFIILSVPTGATQLSFGNNDTLLRDNTGSFSLTVFQMESDFLFGNGFAGSQDALIQYPASPYCGARITDFTALSVNGTTTNIKATVFIPFFPEWELVAGAPGSALISPFFGQRFPRGAQNWGGAPAGTGGQQFPY